MIDTIRDVWMNSLKADLFARRILSSRVECRVESSPNRVSSRPSRFQVKSQVKSIIVKSSQVKSM